MTLSETLKCVLRKWYVVIIIPLVMGLVVFWWADHRPKQYIAGAGITVSAYLADSNALAQKIAQESSTEGIVVSRWSVAASRTTTIYAVGKPKKELPSAANQALDRLQAELVELHPDIQITNAYHAESASKVSTKGQKRAFVSMAVAVGLGAALSLILIWETRAKRKRAQHGRNADASRKGEALARRRTRRSEAFKLSHAFKGVRIVCYCAIGVALALTTNSLVVFPEPFQLTFYYILLGCFLAVGMVCWWLLEASPQFLRGWAVWILLLGAVYMTLSFINVNAGSEGIHFFFAFLALFPFGVHMISVLGERDLLIRSFTSVVCFFALTSVVLWVLGPIGHVIEPNCSAVNPWTAIPGQESVNRGYFFLLYEAQNLAINGTGVWRNTGVFPETPMYSYVLCVALYLELFLVKKPRKAVVAIIAAAAVTAVGTTAIILLLAALFAVLLFKVPASKRWFIIVPVAIACVGVGAYVLLGKLGNGSGMTHVDDFRACFLAWLDHPLTGNGFDNQVAAQGYMSDFRLFNPGLSNSLGYVLMSGGILYLLLYVVAFLGYFVRSSSREKVAGLGLFVLWSVTIISSVPLTAFVLALGVEMLCSRAWGAWSGAGVARQEAESGQTQSAQPSTHVG